MNKNRPQTIIWFDWLFWSAIIVSYLGESLLDKSTLDLLWFEILFLGLTGVFWYFLARRANIILKWIYAVLAIVAIGLYGLVVISSAFELEFSGAALLSMSMPGLVLGGVVNSLSVGAAILLFLKPSKIWFESGGTIVTNSEQLSDVFK